MPVSTFTVTTTSWSAHQAELRALRTAVFVEEQGVPANLEWDEEDASATHAWARDATGQTIGTGRLLPASGRIGRMAVRADWRGRGVGRAILTCLMEAARTQQLATVTLHAQLTALPFYRHQGFALQGEPFLEAGIQHQTMTRTL